jgi:hypothetical protein
MSRTSSVTVVSPSGTGVTTALIPVGRSSFRPDPQPEEVPHAPHDDDAACFRGDVQAAQGVS